MKKHIISLSIGIFFSAQIIGQVTFEHAYQSDGADNDRYWQAFFADDSINYYTFDNSINQVKFYNSSHVLFKTVDLNLGADYFIDRLMLVTDKLFYLDNKIEFLVASSSGSARKMTLFNEDGTNLYEFGNRSAAVVIKNYDIDYKLLVKDAGWSTDFEVYSLIGTLSVEQVELLANFGPYPNPTSNKISFPVNLDNGKSFVAEVYNLSGAKVLAKDVIVTNNKVELDVSNLITGVYVCKLNGRSYKIIKN